MDHLTKGKTCIDNFSTLENIKQLSLMFFLLVVSLAIIFMILWFLRSWNNCELIFSTSRKSEPQKSRKSEPQKSRKTDL